VQVPAGEPIDGPSFDDVLKGLVQHGDVAPQDAVPASDWQPFTSTTPSAPATPRAPADDFIVVGSDTVDAAAAPPAPSAPAPSTPPARPAVVSPAPAAAGSDFVVIGDDQLPEPVAATAPRERTAPASTLVTESTAAPAEAAPRTRPRSAVAPPAAPQPEIAPPAPAAAQRPAATPSVATPAPPAVADGQAASDDVERARIEEQSRAAATRRRVDTVREQGGRDERTVRQISPDGRVRRAQYDEPTAKAGESEFNVDALQREYAGIYYLIKRGDAAMQQGLDLEAKQNYGNALDRLLKLKETAPTWQADIVNYRIDYCRERMRSVQ